jgi:hypothetical protein
MDKFNFPKINTTVPTIPNIKDQNLADAFHKRLIDYIVNFEKDLKPDEEVGARLISFGETMIIHIDDLGYWNPSLICFYGRDNSNREVQLIQHVTQISILLIKVPRTDPKRERIGYKLQHEQNQDNQTKE